MTHLLRKVILVAAAGWLLLCARAVWSDSEQVPVDLSADRLRYHPERREVVAEGQVRMDYRDFHVQADYMKADLKEETAQFSGHVKLTAQNEDFFGDSLVLNLRTQTWEFTYPRSELSPAFFKTGVLEPLFVGGEKVGGSAEDLQITRGSFTSCTLREPHYHIEAKQISIYPKQRLVARKVSLWAGKSKLFTLPYFFVSLREHRRQPFVPEVGESEYEGKYVKTLWNYLLGDRSYGSVHLDFMEKQGLGKGLDHSYLFPKGKSSLYLYQMANRATGRQEWTGRLEHEQSLSEDFDLRLLSDYRHYTYYYAAQSSVSNTQLSLARRRPDGSSRVMFDYWLTQGLGRYQAFSTSLSHDIVKPSGSISVQSNYQAHTTAPGNADDLELNTLVRWQDYHGDYDLDLLVQKRFDLDRGQYTGDNFFQAIDRLPELTLSTTTQKMGWRPVRQVPGRMSLTVGNYYENPTKLGAYRVNLGYDLYPNTIRLGKDTDLRVIGNFKQTFYGDQDKTAQYAYGGNVNLRSQLGSHWTASFNYHLLEPKGYTPFRFDWIGRYQSLAGGLNMEADRARIALLSGYDFRSKRWQDLLARMDFQLRDNLRFLTSAAYDLNQRKPRDIINRIEFFSGAKLRVRLGSRFDPNQKRWRRAMLDLYWQLTPKWRVEALTGYDGLQRKLLYNEVMVTHDLHCWEARFQYSLQRKMFRVDLRIKAFEWGRRDFGVGRYGQYLDTSTGEWY